MSAHYLVCAEWPVVEDVPALHLGVPDRPVHVQVGQHPQLVAAADEARGQHVVVGVGRRGALLVLLVGRVPGPNVCRRIEEKLNRVINIINRHLCVWLHLFLSVLPKGEKVPKRLQ